MAELRQCARCLGEDTGPRHYVSGMRVERDYATLSNGTSVALDRPVDEFYHLDCHAQMGCEHCKDVVDFNQGNVRDEGPVQVPEHLVTIEPGEFTINEFGVHTRALSKEEAIAQREGEAQQAGIEVLPAAEADQLHAEHQG